MYNRIRRLAIFVAVVAAVLSVLALAKYFNIRLTFAKDISLVAFLVLLGSWRVFFFRGLLD
jgi:hypothetical protein